MASYGKSFDERFRELIKAGKSRAQALTQLLIERKLEITDVPPKHKAKQKEKKRGRKTAAK